MEKKLVGVFKKVTIELISVFEHPDTQYKEIGVDSDGDKKFGYVEHPTKTENTQNTELIYTQTFNGEDLDVQDLVLHINKQTQT